MAEWLKAHAWKACVRETVPWVRIPLSPPLVFSGKKVPQNQAFIEPVYLHGGAPRWSTQEHFIARFAVLTEVIFLSNQERLLPSAVAPDRKTSTGR
jgi:hypothetical protein